MIAIIAFAPAFDTPGKHDATGAFQPEASAFVKARGGRVLLVDNEATKAAMRQAVLNEIHLAGPNVVAFFCHGSRNGIQLGFDTRTVNELAKCLWLHPRVRVVLYACSTGNSGAVGGDGGFADELRDALCRDGSTGCQVDAHTTAGHTTRNPYVRRFEGRGSPVGGVGGYYLVSPSSKLWPKWRKAMHGYMRFDFPFLSVGELHERLVSG